MTKTNQANLCRHLADAANNFPNDLAVAVQKRKSGQFKYQELTFFQLNKSSDQIAFALNQYGLKAGDKAVLMVTPSLDFFRLTFALFKAGIVPILVDPGMGTKNLKQCFLESKPNAFIGIPKAHLARRLFKWGSETIKHNITVAGCSLWGGISLTKLLKKYPIEHSYPTVKLEEKQKAAILFTSGSTGTPKGVIYTHQMFEAQISVLRNDYQIKHGERDLATFPLFSLFGPALGMASIIPDMDASKPISANPDNLFAAIKKYHCSNLFVNPALMDVLGKAGMTQGMKLPSLQRVISAGAPATIEAIKRFSKLLNKEVEILNAYGATESLPVSHIESKQLRQTELISETGGGICVGKSVSGIDISIIKITEESIDKWDEKLKLPHYEIGEIVVKGPQVSTSYYHRPQATEQAKIQDGPTIRHRMGDLGYIDEFGKLWMCGRKAHRVEAIINDINKTFYSICCERIFNTHPEIKRTALIAIKENDSTKPLLVIERLENSESSPLKLFNELKFMAKRHQQTIGIEQFLIHSNFPMDIRHNAKIFREQLALWAQQEINR